MTFFTETKSLPDQFPHGLRVLVVDHDITILNSIAEMCIRRNYHVTTCYEASFALNLLKERKNLYDVILIEAQMPDMDSYSFLQHVVQQINIPVILMCGDESTSLVTKALEKGACGYWLKPLNEGQIKNIWQHVVRKVLNENKQQDQVLEISKGKVSKKTGKDHDYAPTSCVVKKKNVDDNINYQPSTKKSRLSWSSELHQRFLWAVNQIGNIDEAKPKKITKLMDVPGLTTEHVASHLQKLRLCLKRSTEEMHVKNKMPEVRKKKSKFDKFDFQALITDNAVQNNVPNETMPKEHGGLLNSAIECDNSFHAQPSIAVEDYEISDIDPNIFSGLDNIPTLCEAWSLSQFDIFN